MSGYFSKIARQSGARVAGKPGVVREPVEPATPLSRIDRNEVVMVAPDASPPHEHEAPQVEGKAIPESQKQPVTESRGQTIETKRDPNPPRIAHEPAMPDASRPNRDAIEPASVRTEASSLSPEEEIGEPLRPEVSNTTVMIPRVESPTSLPEKRENEIDHFAETIKIVAGREMSKDEASSILVREIHEWIAAGATDGPALEIEEVVPRDDAVAARQVETEEAPEMEPGVVRIFGEGASRPQSPSIADQRPSEQTTLQEHTLDLSIGTINVVIEGDPAPPAAQQPQRARPSEPLTQPTRSSRLRRSYL